MENVIPIDALYGEGFEPNPAADPRAALNEAELIFGVDWMTQNKFVVFGAAVLDEIIKTGQAKPLRVLEIGIDQDTPELEKLLALVQTIKGKHDYRAGLADQD